MRSQHSNNSSLVTERPATLELPRPLRSSLRKYNYSYNSSARTPGPWPGEGGNSGLMSNIETPPDSSLSEDSSYVSAKDSSLASMSSQHSNPPVPRVRFSPIAMVCRDPMDLPIIDRTMPMQPYRNVHSAGNSSRAEFSSPKLRKNLSDYGKFEFLRNF